jgi:hypothetical protein
VINTGKIPKPAGSELRNKPVGVKNNVTPTGFGKVYNYLRIEESVFYILKPYIYLY